MRGCAGAREDARRRLLCRAVTDGSWRANSTSKLYGQVGSEEEGLSFSVPPCGPSVSVVSFAAGGFTTETQKTY